MEEILFRLLISTSGATLIFGGMLGYVLIKIQRGD
jgi:hypothetical protein